MARESGESYPNVSPNNDLQITGPVENDFFYNKNGENADRKTCRKHPDYLATALRVAVRLYPNDKEMIDAFIFGTDHIVATQRQKKIAEEKRELIFCSDDTSADDDDASGQLPASA